MRLSQLHKEYPGNIMLDVIDENIRKPQALDEDPQQEMELIINDEDGDNIYECTLSMKHFKSGKIGYNGNGTLINPKSGDKYQVSVNLILMGS